MFINIRVILYCMSEQESKSIHNQNQENSILNVGEMNSCDDMENAYNKLLSDLVDAIIEGYDSDRFTELMDTLAIAGSYSTKNKFLIQAQNTDVIGPFNGYNQWINNFGRIPEKGTDALWILAPCTMKYCDKSDDPCKYCDDCDDKCDNTRDVVVGYKSVTTFAYSQTVEMSEEDKPDDTKDITVLSQKKATSEVDKKKLNELYNELIQLYERFGFNVNEISSKENWDISSSARGYYEHKNDNISVRNFRLSEKSESVNIEERISTLIHEIAHYLLDHKNEDLSDSKMEMEAESVAYIVCQSLNINTDAGVYISSHLQNEISNLTEREEVKDIVQDSIDRIGETSSKILEGIRK